MGQSHTDSTSAATPSPLDAALRVFPQTTALPLFVFAPDLHLDFANDAAKRALEDSFDGRHHASRIFRQELVDVDTKPDEEASIWRETQTQLNAFVAEGSQLPWGKGSKLQLWTCVLP